MCYANIVRDLSRAENRRYSVLDLKKNQDKEGIKVPVIIPHLNVELISLLSPIIWPTYITTKIVTQFLWIYP